MAVKIQVKRGTKAGLPALAPGEYGLATDTGELFIGGPNGNIQVAVLGSDHKLPSEQMPTHNHGAGDINSGILGVARGGTGKGSWTANRLIYPSAAATLAQLGFPPVAGSVLRQGTSGAPYWTSPADLLAALGLTNAAKIATGSYVGTGTYGANNPCSLTFDFVPKLLIMLNYDDNTQINGKYFNGALSMNPVQMIIASRLTDSYTPALQTNYFSQESWYNHYCNVKKSPDGKTISWYHDGAKYQFNNQNWTYWYLVM